MAKPVPPERPPARPGAAAAGDDIPEPNNSQFPCAGSQSRLTRLSHVATAPLPRTRLPDPWVHMGVRLSARRRLPPKLAGTPKGPHPPRFPDIRRLKISDAENEMARQEEGQHHEAKSEEGWQDIEFNPADGQPIKPAGAKMKERARVAKNKRDEREISMPLTQPLMWLSRKPCPGQLQAVCCGKSPKAPAGGRGAAGKSRPWHFAGYRSAAICAPSAPQSWSLALRQAKSARRRATQAQEMARIMRYRLQSIATGRLGERH